MGNPKYHISYSYDCDSLCESLPFWAISSGSFTCDDSYFTKRDGLDNFLLIYTKKGSGYVEHSDKTYTLPPNSMVLIDCNRYHHYKTLDDSWSFLWVHFSGASALPYYNIINQNGFAPIDVHENSELDSLFSKLFSVAFKMESDKQVILSNIIHSILTISYLENKSYTPSNKYAIHKSAIDKIIRYIEQNYNSNITIDSLSELTNISKFYLIKIFKYFTRKTPYEYILEYRISIAKLLLAQDNLSVSEIASLVGFTDQKIFITNFKKITGTTPLQHKSTNNILLP